MTLFYLTYDQINKIRMKSSKLNLEIGMLEKQTSGKENPYIIDYIMCRSVTDSIKRSGNFEGRRNMLTC